MDKKSVSESGAGAEPTSENTKTTAAAESPASTQPTTAPVQPVAVAETSAPETMSATDATTGALVDTVVYVKPPKKKKTGLIIGIIIAILLILSGIGVAIWYFAVYQNPENVVFDAVNNFIAAKSVSPSAAFKATVSVGDGYEAEISVTTESSSRRLPNETSIWLSLNVRDDSGNLMTDEAIEINVGTIQMADGVAYLKLDNLTETLDQILPNIFPTPVTNCAPTVTNCLPPVNPIETALYEIAELLDDEWWRIALSDILDEIDDLEDWQADALEDFYACALDVMNTDTSDEMALLYRRNRFIDVNELAYSNVYPENTTGYSVSLNYDALANFLNASKRSSASNAFYDCYNAAIDKASRRADSYYYDDEDFEEMKISPDDIKDATASDLKKFFPTDAEIILFIDPWSHALREVSVRLAEDEEYSVSLMLGFTYEAKSVDAPSDYRPITELFNEISDIMYDLYYDYDDDYYYPDYCDADDSEFCYNGGFEFPIEIGV